MNETTQVSQEPFRCAMFSLFPATVCNISKLPDEQFCMIMRALIAHYWDPDAGYAGEDSLVSLVYSFVSGEMDRYTEKCRKNSENRSRSKSSGKENRTQAVQRETECQQTETNEERTETNEERNITQDQGQGQGKSKDQSKSKSKNQNQHQHQSKNQNQGADTAPDSVRQPEIAAARNGADGIRKEFDKLWERFPNKMNKELALTSYQRDRQAGAAEQEIRRGLERYLAYLDTVPPAEKELMKGNIWFGMQCWKEEKAYLYKRRL